MAKKTETIEVRMSPDLKLELSELSKQREQPMSQVIRQLIEQELSSAEAQVNPTGDTIMPVRMKSQLVKWGGSGAAVLALALMWNVGVQSTASADAGIRVTFAAMDQNEDGVISRKEFERFTSLDALELVDQELSEDEMKLLTSEETDPLPEACKADFEQFEADEGHTLIDEFTEMDQDKNGSVDFGELRHLVKLQQRELFLELDRNVDGYLTKPELVDFQGTVDPAISADCAKALLEQEEAQADKQELRYVMAHFDENNDKKISLDEFLNNQNDSFF